MDFVPSSSKHGEEINIEYLHLHVRTRKGKNDSKRRSRFVLRPIDFQLCGAISPLIACDSPISYREWVSYLRLMFCQQKWLTTLVV